MIIKKGKPVSCSVKKLRLCSTINLNFSFSSSKRLLYSIASFDTSPGKKIISPSFNTYSNSTRCTGKIYKFTFSSPPFFTLMKQDYTIFRFHPFCCNFICIFSSTKSIGIARQINALALVIATYWHFNLFSEELFILLGGSPHR